MKDKVRISGIKIETAAGEMSLTIDQARELYNDLHSIFGKTIEYIPSQPIIIDRDYWRPTWSPYPTITVKQTSLK